MELKIDVYKNGAVEKSYTAKDFRLMMGTCEDILKLVDIDKLTGKIDDEQTMMEIMKIVIKAFMEFKPMIQEIFPDMTDDEYRRTQVVDVAGVVIQVVKYTMSQLFSVVSGKGKN